MGVQVTRGMRALHPRIVSRASFAAAPSSRSARWCVPSCFPSRRNTAAALHQRRRLLRFTLSWARPCPKPAESSRTTALFPACTNVTLCAVITRGRLEAGTAAQTRTPVHVPSYDLMLFHRRWSFIFVWSNFWVIKSGSQSIISLIFGT